MAFRGLRQRIGDSGGKGGGEQDDPSESAPSEDTTSICNWQVSVQATVLLKLCPVLRQITAVAHQSEYSEYFTLRALIKVGSRLEMAILALLSRY